MSNEFENNSETELRPIGSGGLADSPNGPFVRVVIMPVLEIAM